MKLTTQASQKIRTEASAPRAGGFQLSSLLLIPGFCISTALAESTPTGNEQIAALDADAAEFAELLEVISEETTVATKTKMNSDFVPGIVTVLDGEKLAALGARTVLDAMSFVPGVAAGLDPRGTPTIMVRGIPFPFNNGQIQILLNGVAIQRDSAGINGTVLHVPIAQVERIEFVRGPGSVVYGDFSQQGLLNIVTHNEGTSVGVETDSRDATGVNARHGGQYGDWHLAANVSTQDGGEALLPGNQATEETRRFAVLSVRHGGFAINGQGFETEMADGSPAPPDSNLSDKMFSVDASYSFALSEALDAQLRTHFIDNAFFHSRNDFAGTQVRSAFEVIWRGQNSQSLLAGIDFSDGNFDKANYVPPVPPGSPPPPRQTIAPHERTVLGAYLQSQTALTEHIHLTVGARYDDNSETGERLTPRAALAWQFAQRHVIKAQYAEGYRSPTYFELYSSATIPVLDFEVNKTTELNYVYQQPGTIARVTLFHSKIDDMIFRAPPTFGNIASATSNGIELEWNQQLSASLRTDINLSTADSEHNRTPAPLRNIAIGAAPSWLGNIALLWTPMENTLLGVHLNHVGPRHDAPAGSKDYDMLNLTLTRQNLLMRGVDLRLGVTNALDERVVQFSYSPAGNVPLAFDYRTTWASLTWRM